MALDRRKVWNVGDTAGTPRTRALAAALRRARMNANIGVREAARLLDLSHTTISQWETGKRVPSIEDVSAMLQAIRVTGKRRDDILDLARGSIDHNWLAKSTSDRSQGLIGILECERTATEIITWEPLVIPGFLQTVDYARAIFSANDEWLPREIDARIRVRLDRQRVFTEERDELEPAEFVAIIGEWAIRQQVGGAATLSDQLRHVLKIAELSTVTVQVAPIGGDWHPGLSGAFTLYNFVESPSIVSLEHHRSCVFLYDEYYLAEYKIATNRIRRNAMSPEDSSIFISELINEMEAQA